MKNKRLCFVIPSLDEGGMERVMSELVSYFSKKTEIEVHLVLYGREPLVFYSVSNEIKIHKARKAFNNNYRVFAALGRLLFLRHTIRKIDPDVILSFGEFWNSFVLLALFGLNYPVYISDRCSPAKEFSRFHSFLRNWLYPRSRGVIAQTDLARNIYMKQFNHRNIKVIGNPIHQPQCRGNPPERENIVLSVGRLINSKHHDKLIEIFTETAPENWKLIIIGGDALKQKNSLKLSKLIHELGMNKKIILTGRQSEIDNYYLKSKVFAFTSSSEGFPNAIGEALSAGMPVVAFDCIAGPSEMVTDQFNGFLVPINDWAAFKVRLSVLMRDEELRYSLAKNSDFILQKFSVEVVGEKYFNFLFSNDQPTNSN